MENVFRLNRYTRNSADYSAGKYILWLFVSALFFVNSFSFIVPIKLKVIILKLFGAKLGMGLVIKPGVKIKYPWKLSIGDSVWLGENVWIENIGNVKIGNNVCLSQGVTLCTGNHNYKSIDFELIEHSMDIGSNVWIGCFNVILPGENVTSGTFVPAQSNISRYRKL